MKKFLMLFIMVITLFTSCSSSYVHSEYKGYEYVINEGEDLYRTYSFFGEKAITILKDEVKQEYDDRFFLVTSFDELERITTTKKLKDILGKDVFGEYYLGLFQRNEEYGSIYALNCAYDLDILVQDTSSGGWVEANDLYLEVNRHFKSRSGDPEIINDYVLDIILLPKNISRDFFNGYGGELKVDHYENKLLVEKDGIEYIYNKKYDSYDVYGSNKEDVEIESKIRNKPVENIRPRAFYYSKNLKHVKIPFSIKKIGRSSFEGCLSLLNAIVEKQSKLEYIGIKAFYATSITHFNVPSSVLKIDNGAFGNCLHLRNVGFDNDSKCKEIGNKSFSNCISLDGIELPSSLESVGNRAFYNSYLKQVYIPISVVTMGEEVFSSESVEKINLEILYQGEKIPSSWSSLWNKDILYTIYYNRLPNKA